MRPSHTLSDDNLAFDRMMGPLLAFQIENAYFS